MPWLVPWTHFTLQSITRKDERDFKWLGQENYFIKATLAEEERKLPIKRINQSRVMMTET
jgi:hypothetical protein